MNKNLFKMLVRSIKASFGRYMAILAIVALGVGFFAGLKSSEPAMSGTADDYLRSQHMYDFQLMSTLGITEDDVEAFKELDYISHAEGGYSLDVLVGDETYKFYSLTEEVCVPVLLEGRMPENDRECLGDSLVFKSEDIGSTLTVSSSNEEDTLDMLRYNSYTVVGIAKTPRYISAERGSTHLGSGSIKGFVLLPDGAFDSEAYHELLLIGSNLTQKAFSDEYDSARDSLEEDVETFFNQRGALRYKELRAEADEELADARKELDDGWQEYEDGKKKLEKELQKASKNLNDSQYLLDEGKKEIESNLAQLEKAEKMLPLAIAQIDSKIDENNAVKADAYTKMSGIGAEVAAYAAAVQSAAEKVAQLQAQLETAEDESQKAQLEAELAAASAELSEANGLLAAKNEEFSAAQVEYGTAVGTEEYLLGMKAEYEAQYAALPAAYDQINAAWAEIMDKQLLIEIGWKEYSEGKEDAEKELADALKELEDGEQEYLDAIEEVKEELQLELFTLTRSENSGCATFKNDVSIVDAIADVFPVFFALIAALVCSTTMTRMVTEERTQIGTLKAMGYSSGAIMGKYMLYSGSSAFFGCVLGFAMGVTAIPYIVWNAYGILYDYAKLQFYYSLEMCAACLAVAVLGTLLVTWYACGKELMAKPAELIRPKVEGKGKRVFIEYITPLWKRLSFLNKVTIRNALRYKSRVFMMLLGIGGCTALLVTGFGIRDSVMNVLGDQYDKIFLYDLSVKYDPDEFSPQADVEKLWQDKGNYAMSYQVEATLTNEVDEKTAQLIATDKGALDGMIKLFNDEGEIAYPEAGQAVITTRIAQQLELESGDTVRVTSGDGLDKELLIAAVCENYVGNYIYVLPETVDNEPCNTAVIKCSDDVEVAAFGASLRSEEGVDYVSIMEHEKKMMSDSMASLDLVVALLIVCSGALAFITLYNLTNINLLERIREVATVKVLGFYHKETASYILRENVMLSFLGAIVGMFMGKAFHAFVISLLQVEGMCFGDEIAVLSYALGFVMTIFFAWLCNLSMHGKLKRVNMTESLKSVE